jgi:hypothetical protein
LTNTELTNITTVACLEARQRNPAVHCFNETLVKRPLGSSFVGQPNAGNYPPYKDPQCNSNGEFFCDPSGLLTSEERRKLTDELGKLRNLNPVVCGHMLDDPVDPRHYQPFYLGVALASRWPLGESDPDSLQHFGQIIAGNWNMDNLFVGSPQPYLRCPNTAVLIVLPDLRRVFLSSSSCEFVCHSKGGPEIVQAATAALSSEGLAAAIHAAIVQVYSAVSQGRPQPEASAAKELRTKQRDMETEMPNASTLMQRIFFGFSAVAAVISLLIGVLVLLIVPGWVAAGRRRK